MIESASGTPMPNRLAQVDASSASVQVYELSGLARSMTDCTNAQVRMTRADQGQDAHPDEVLDAAEQHLPVVDAPTRSR